jgi:hypothetical protein
MFNRVSWSDSFRSETYEHVWMKYLSFTLYIWWISCASKINLHSLQFWNLILYDLIWSGYCKHIRSNCSSCTARWVSRPDSSVGNMNRCNATRQLWAWRGVLTVKHSAWDRLFCVFCLSRRFFMSSSPTCLYASLSVVHQCDVNTGRLIFVSV